MTDWETAARAAASPVIARCTESTARAPRIAYCVAGAARSFATPLVLTMLRHNLYRVLGGDAEGSRFFLQLKQLDSDKLVTGVMRSSTSFRRHNETTLAHLLAALATPWLRAATGEAVVVDGSGASTATGRAEQPVAPSDDQLWRQFRATQCNATARAHGATRCCHMGEYLRAGNNQERMILHHLGPSWCASAIARYEARSGRAFDLVVYARPDLVWWQPVVPWCELRWREQIIACHEPGCDMAWIAPRRAAEVLMSTAELHRDCGVDTCCSTSERLLWLAEAKALRLHGLTANHRLGKALFHSQDTHNGQGALQRAAGQTASLLRSVHGVCKLAFDRAFAADARVDRHSKDAFRFIPQRGLPIATIASLRRVVNDSVKACRQALAWVGE